MTSHVFISFPTVQIYDLYKLALDIHVYCLYNIHLHETFWLLFYFCDPVRCCSINFRYWGWGDNNWRRGLKRALFFNEGHRHLILSACFLNAWRKIIVRKNILVNACGQTRSGVTRTCGLELIVRYGTEISI